MSGRNDGVRWIEGEPSRNLGAKQRWDQVADTLRERPGVWAVIDTGHQGLVSSARTCLNLRGRFEVAQKSIPAPRGTSRDKRRVEVLARYLGD